MDIRRDHSGRRRPETHLKRNEDLDLMEAAMNKIRATQVVT